MLHIATNFPIVRCAIIISPTTEGVCTEVVRGSVVLAQLLLLLLGGAREGGAVGWLREQLHGTGRLTPAGKERGLALLGLGLHACSQYMHG